MLVNRRTPAVMVVDEEEPVAEEDVMEIVVETHADSGGNGGWDDAAASTVTPAAIGDWENVYENVQQPDANPGTWGLGPAARETAESLPGQDDGSGFYDTSQEEYGHSGQ
jgi:hypothetical protein